MHTCDWILLSNLCRLSLTCRISSSTFSVRFIVARSWNKSHSYICIYREQNCSLNFFLFCLFLLLCVSEIQKSFCESRKTGSVLIVIVVLWHFLSAFIVSFHEFLLCVSTAGVSLFGALGSWKCYWWTNSESVVLFERKLSIPDLVICASPGCTV
jgi:hypothetical protein